jgi:hypothetical protein
MSSSFADICSAFLDQTVVNFPDGTLNNMFETCFDRLYDIIVCLDTREQICAFLCPLIGMEPNNETVKTFLRMLIKKTVNPPQMRPDEAFDHLHIVAGSVSFAPTAPAPHYNEIMCSQYMDILVRYTLRFIKTCVPANMDLLVDMMTMDIVTYIISDIAYGYVRQDYEQESDAHFREFARMRRIGFRPQELTLASTLRRFPALIRSQIVEGIVIRCQPIYDLPSRIKIHLPSSGDVCTPGRDLLFDVKKHARACTPGDGVDLIRKKDGSGEFAWDRCHQLTGYLCPSASSTTEEINIVFTPGHNGDVSTTPGYVYGTISRSDAVSTCFRDSGMAHISSFLPIFNPILGNANLMITNLVQLLADPTFLDTCLDTIVQEAQIWWRDGVPTDMPQFATFTDDL